MPTGFMVFDEMFETVNHVKSCVKGQTMILTFSTSNNDFDLFYSQVFMY